MGMALLWAASCPTGAALAAAWYWREETGGGGSEKKQQEANQMKLGGDRNRPDIRRGRGEFIDGHGVSPSSIRGVFFAACRADVGQPKFLQPNGGALPFRAGRTGRSYA